MPEYRYDAYLSYYSTDRMVAEQLAVALRARGLKVWFADWELVPGLPWQQATIDGLAASRILILLLGRGPSIFFNSELDQASYQNKPVIPVLVDGIDLAEIPARIRAITWVDIRGGLDSEKLSRLEWGISGKKPSAPEWQSSSLKPPEIPPALATALMTGRCVLFAGNGVAIANGYPSFFELLSRIAESQSIQPAPGVKATFLGESLAEQLGEGIAGDVGRVYQRRTEGDPAKLLKDLARLPFAGLIQANWDNSLAELFAIPTSRVRVFDDLEKLELISLDERFVFRLWGDLQRPGSLIFTGSQLAKRLRHPLVQKYFTSLLASYSLFFVGSSLDSIQEFLDLVGPSATASPHFALLPVDDEPAERYLRGFLEKRYSVHMIGFDPVQKFAAAGDFIALLADATEATRAAQDESLSVPLNGSNEPTILQSVSLRDIGPFHELDLQFKPGWNLLLGNNGCGKSSVLRAIAHALTSDEPEAQSGLATRGLLRAGSRSGKIELRGEKQSWSTELFREGESTRTYPSPRPPFQKGRSVVLGFPALRGISAANPRGPMSDGPSSPQIADLLPLIQASADFRLDSSKQWIVNAWARQQHALLAKYFAILRDLTPGVDFELSRVDTQNWSVLVKTPDGEIPLDFLSQGTSSIISWVGVLIERLYELHPSLEDPTQEPALVLIDEIDAHMHPEWQQSLVPLLRQHFPKLQVIATTHSPLLLGSFEANEVYHFERDEKTRQIHVARLKTSFLGWRADQILTSPAFGLETTISQDVEGWQKEFSALMARSDLNEVERARLAELDELIKKHVPSHPETQVERDALEGLEAFFTTSLREKPDEERQRIAQEAEKLLREIRAGK